MSNEVKIINGYPVKDVKAIRTYDTVADMKGDRKLKVGQHVKTRGHYSINDGGSCEYYITNTQSESEYQENLENGLYASKIINNYINPDDFKGTDTEKLQKSLDSIYTKGGNIIINREYIIENDILIKQNSNDNNIINIIGLGNNAILNLTDYSIKGYDENERYYGGVTFENLKLTGNNTCVKTKHLIRIKFINCIISDFEHFIYEDDSSSTVLQSIYLINCVLRNTTDVAIYLIGSVYDLKITNCLIEWCKGLLYINGTQYQITLLNNCIEGINTNYMINLIGTVIGFNFSYNYIEYCLNGYINLKSIINSQNTKININNNEFFGRNTNAKYIELPILVSYGSLSIYNNGTNATNDYLVYVDDNSTLLRNVYVNENTGNIYDVNNKLPRSYRDTQNSLPITFYGSGDSSNDVVIPLSSVYSAGFIIMTKQGVGVGTATLYPSDGNIAINDLSGSSVNSNLTLTYDNTHKTLTISSSATFKVSLMLLTL